MVENDDNNNDTLNVNKSIPANCAPLTHQVAGHFYGKGRTKLGITSFFSFIFDLKKSIIPYKTSPD
jgi:hypothetical protein